MILDMVDLGRGMENLALDSSLLIRGMMIEMAVVTMRIGMGQIEMGVDQDLEVTRERREEDGMGMGMEEVIDLSIKVLID